MSMSLDGNSRVAEALVDALTIDGTTLTAASLSNLSGNEFEELVELSSEIELSNEMDSTEEELIEDVVVEPEFDIHEVEIETERNRSPQAQEIIPEVKVKSTVPPLRPLTIAPKPARVPFTIKSTGGQQLLLLPGGTSGQPLKLMSPQGQGISIANLSLGKPITICPAGRTQSSNMSVLQPKQVIMKKINPQKVVETQSKPVTTNLLLQSSPSKTITFARAQQLGLISPKYNSQIVTKQSVTTAKPQAKTFKLVPQGKKILPAPQSMSSNKGTQRIVLKQANANSSIISPTQILQVTGGQPVVAGQLHQINIPGKGVQYIKLVTSSSNSDSTITNATVTSVSGGHSHQTKSMEPKLSVISPGGNISSKLTNVVLSESITTAHIAPKPIKTNAMSCGNTVHLPAPGQLVMLPANYLTTAKVAIPPNVKPKPAVLEPTANTISEVNMESNGIRPRKPCNCTKSQCLKLYCDCFANGEFCNMCNCMNCFNNLENEEHRQRAIKSCLERNPSAFRPKIGKAKDMGDASIRKHTKGCNCKRSGCLKNYCECYEAKIACSNNCKCVSCRNVEDSIDEKEMQTIANVPLPTYTPMLTKVGVSRNIQELRPKRHSNSKQASSYITSDVIDATCRCMLLMAANAQNNGLTEEEQKKAVLIEYGKCLKEIIDSSKGRYIKNDEN